MQAPAAYQPRPMQPAPPSGSTANLVQPAPAPTTSLTMPGGMVARPSGPAQQCGMARVMSSNGVPTNMAVRPMMSQPREHELERVVSELKAQLAQKDRQVQELQTRLSKYVGTKGAMASPKRKSLTTGGSNGGRKLNGGRPSTTYAVTDRQDPVDVQLEEFYNSSGSAVPFRRINKGYYRFGDTFVEVSIINHKLMAKTEDGWNRGKYGPIDKFLAHYEGVERERLGIADA